MGLIARGTDRTPPRLIATYISHSVGRGLLSGQVEMVPYDNPPVETGPAGNRAGAEGGSRRRTRQGRTGHPPDRNRHARGAVDPPVARRLSARDPVGADTRADTPAR